MSDDRDLNESAVVPSTLSTFDLKVYRRAGLDPSAAEEWAAAGIRPYQAEGFRRAGLDLAGAAQLAALGMSGNYAARAVAAGEDPAEAWERERVQRRRDRAAADERLERQALRRAEAEEEFLTFDDDDLVTISDIAEMVGVDRAVASRWASDERFPAPEASGRSPLFSLRKVVDHFAGPTSVRSATFDPKRLNIEWAWSVYSRRSLEPDGADNPRELAAALVTLATACRQQDGPALSELWGDEVMSSATGPGRAGRLTEALKPLRDVPGYGELVDELSRITARVLTVPFITIRRIDHALALGLSPALLLDSLLDGQGSEGRGRRRNSTNHALADLIVELAQPERDERVHDPACGEGELLLWCSQRVGRSSAVELSGCELDPGAARIARCRLYLRGIPGSITTGDSFDRPDSGANVVIADPELGTSRKQIAAWLALTTGHRGTPADWRGRRAVVALPKAAVPSAAAPSAPLDLYRHVIRAVVLVPARIKPGARDFIAVVMFGQVAVPERPIVVLDLRNVELSSSERLLKPSRHSASTSGPDLRRDWLHIPRDFLSLIDEPRSEVRHGGVDLSSRARRLAWNVAAVLYDDLAAIVDHPLERPVGRPAQPESASDGGSATEHARALLDELARSGDGTAAGELQEVLRRLGLIDPP